MPSILICDTTYRFRSPPLTTIETNLNNKPGAIIANSNTASTIGDYDIMSSLLKNSNTLEEPLAWEATGICVYIFQIIFSVDSYFHDFVALYISHDKVHF